jgi:GDP-L-fucose synthase
MVGSSVWRLLEAEGFTNLVGRTSEELDLKNRQEVFDFMKEERPRYLVLAAAKVGGILANDTYPVEFLTDNIQIQVNVLDAALEYDVERLVFLGSSCIYPKDAPQPLREDYLLSGKLEPTNDAYAIAKIAGVKHVQAARRQYGKNWFAVMPTNLYGPGDNFHPTESHVLASLIRRYTEAKRENLSSVTNWGLCSHLRLFLHADDLASAVLLLMGQQVEHDVVNDGSGDEVSIKDLATLVAEAVGYEGVTFWDHTKPDGTMRKLLDSSRLGRLGWKRDVELKSGVIQSVEAFLASRP